MVIAIIGLLSAIVLTSLNTARAKARDAKKGVMVKQWQIAIESYRFDEGEYPDSGDAFYKCLGEGYPVLTTDYPCITEGKETTTFNDKLREYYPSMPITGESMPVGDGSAYDYRGIGYGRCDKLSPACLTGEEYKIMWYLEDLDSNQEDCIIGGWINGNDGYHSCVFTQE